MAGDAAADAPARAGAETPPAGRRAARDHPSPVPLSTLIQASHRLTARDLYLAQLLSEHRTLTTAQIAALLFHHPTTARNRLCQLREFGFLDRFRHTMPHGTQVVCWVPGLLAARYAALAAGRAAPTPRAVRLQQDQIVASPNLNHQLGVNQFFTDLIHHTRTHPETRLVRWWSAERTAAAFAGRIHPDGHGVWRVGADLAQPVGQDGHQDAGQAFERHDTRHDTCHDSDRRDPPDPDRHPGGVTVGFWLEHDMGSMSVPRVVAKLKAYQRLQSTGGPAFPVLIWVPHGQRERNMLRALTDEPTGEEVAAATGVHRGGHGEPAGMVWLPATAAAMPATHPERVRVHLAALPSDPIPPQS